MNKPNFKYRRELLLSSVATVSFLGGCSTSTDADPTGGKATKGINTPPTDFTAIFQFQHNSHNTGAASGAFEQNETAWSTQIGPIDYGLAASNNHIVVGSGGVLHGLDPATGDHSWKTELGIAIGRTPAMTKTTAYVPVWNGTTRHSKGLVAVDLEEGSVRWRTIPGIGVSTPPTLTNDRVYVGGGTNSDEVIAIDAIDGSVRWRFTAGKYTPSPAVADEVLFAGSGSMNKAYALDAVSGEKYWGISLTGAVRTAPTVEGETVYVGTDEGHLYALSTESGKTNWHAKLDGAVVHSVAVVNDRVYVPVGSSIVALTQSGSTIWKTECKSRVCSPVIAGDTLIAADSGVFGLSIKNGNELWRHSVPDRSIDDMVFSGISATPVVFDNSVYVASHGGLVSKLSP